MHLNQLAAFGCVFGFTLRAVLHPGQRNAHLFRDQPHRFRKANLLTFLHELKNVARFAAAEAMKELPRRVDRERWRLFIVERAQPAVILRPRLLELHVVAHNADNVRLLPHRFLEVAEGGHECLTSFCLKSFAMGMPELWCNSTAAPRNLSIPCSLFGENSLGDGPPRVRRSIGAGLAAFPFRSALSVVSICFFSVSRCPALIRGKDFRLSSTSPRPR